MNKQPGLVNLGLTKSFEVAMNMAIYLDDNKGRAFEKLDGKVVELWIAPSKTPLFCLINQGKVSTQGVLNGEADVTLKTGMRQLIALSQGEPFEHKFIKGDRQIGQDFVNAMQNLEIDWEEHLSHYTGDLIAFKVGHGIRSFMERKQNTKQQVGDTIREYLHFEINTLPTRNQVEHFVKDVEQTHLDIETMAERINQLSAQLKK
ncbi:SCP2 sterol-binding domain-containing protein [Thiomicrorhabdus hydrogeniphila]